MFIYVCVCVCIDVSNYSVWNILYVSNWRKNTDVDNSEALKSLCVVLRSFNLMVNVKNSLSANNNVSGVSLTWLSSCFIFSQCFLGAPPCGVTTQLINLSQENFCFSVSPVACFSSAWSLHYVISSCCMFMWQGCCSSWLTVVECSFWAPMQPQQSSQWCRPPVWQL